MSCTQFLCHFCSQSSSKIARVPEVCDSSRSRLSKRKAGKRGVTSPKQPWSRGQERQFWIRGRFHQWATHYWGTVRGGVCVGGASTPKSSTSTVMAEEGYTFKSQVIFTCHQRRGNMISPRNPAGYGKQSLPRKNRCLWAALRLVRHWWHHWDSQQPQGTSAAWWQPGKH